MSETIILTPHMGPGLGDSMLYTTLPERFVRERGAEVYIRDPGFRNPGIPELVWRTNPFVSGILSQGEAATGMHLPFVHHETLRRLSMKHGNSIKAMEVYMGLDPLNEYPRLYWQPSYNRGLRESVLIDPSSITVPQTKEAFEPFIQHLAERGLIDLRRCVVIDSNSGTHGVDMLPNLPRLTTNGILEYASSIYSCHTFVSTHSGATAVASALKGGGPHPRVYALISQAIYNSQVFVWRNIDYRITGKLLDDFQLV